MKTIMRWTRSLVPTGGTRFSVQVSDGLVYVKREHRQKEWRVYHNGKECGLKFATATEAMLHVEDAEIHGW